MLLDETPETGGAKMETGHGQDVRDFPLAHGGTQSGRRHLNGPLRRHGARPRAQAPGVSRIPKGDRL